MNAQTPVAEKLRLPALVAGGAVRPIVPQDIESAWRVAGYLHDADMLPFGIKTRSQVMIAVMHGLEIGLPPMQALQSIAVINGKPTIYGDAVIGLVRTSGLLEWIKETIEGEGEAMVARCVVKRKNELEPIAGEFSVADAKVALLWNKRGRSGEPTPWVTYPKRMLKARARAFALRDGFADVLRGMHIREEVEDYAEHQGFENAKVVKDDGPPAPPPEPVKTTASPATAPLDPDPVDADFVEVDQDGPPDPNAAPVENSTEASAKLDAKKPVDPAAFLDWAKEAFANCDADMLANTFVDSIEPHIPEGYTEDVMALYRARERELEDAPAPKAETALEAQMLAEIAAHTNPIDLTRWSVANFGARQGIPAEAGVRVEAALSRKLKDLKAAQTK